MVPLHKRFAGNALGYEWPHDGAVVEVSHTDAAVLLSIKDAYFTEHLVPEQPGDPNGAEGDGEAGGEVVDPLLAIANGVAPSPQPENPEPVKAVTEPAGDPVKAPAVADKAPARKPAAKS